MMIELVTHCYAVELSQYAWTLKAQIEAMLASDLARLTVCFWEGDPLTNWVVSQYHTSRVRASRHMHLATLGRRAIGRNWVTQHLIPATTKAVIFTDADYLWTTEALQTIEALPLRRTASMVYPKKIQVSRDWKLGDEQWGRLRDGTFSIIPEEFADQQFNRAIGGVQIVRGSFAREYGYLRDDPKWQQPQTGKPFSDFKDDVAYRRFCELQGPIVAVDIPGIYRIRHTHTSYQAPKVQS